MTDLHTPEQSIDLDSMRSSGIEIRQSTDDALASLAGRLCAADYAELAAVGLHDPLNALRQSAAASREAYVASWHGQVQAAFGIADCPDGSMRGIPWMLSTGRMGTVRKEFHAASRRMLCEWAPMYSSLFNIVSTDHAAARRWLRGLGFVESAPITFGDHQFVVVEATSDV